MKKRTLVVTAFALSFLAGCGDKGTDNNAASSQSKRIDYKVDHQAALLRALPSKAVAYTRIPSLVGMMTTPQADALYPAISNKALQTQSLSILEGIDKNLLSKIEDPQLRELISLFVNKQTAPLEMAVLAASSITPELLLQTKINLADIDELKSLLEQIVAVSQNQLLLAEGPDAEGNFKIAVGPFAAYGYFDLSTKDFVVYGGPTVTESNLTKYRDGSLKKRDDLKTFEAQFDATGSGFAYWMDADKLWTNLSPMAPPTLRPQLEQLNVQDMKFFYMGSASKDGHGSMRMHLQYKEEGDNLFYFPASKPALDVKVAMPLDFAITLPMPNQQHLAQIVKLDEQFNDSPTLGAEIAGARETLKTEFQLDLDQLLAAFGGSFSIVGDKAGTWVSLPIQNSEGFDSLIEITQKKLGATLTKTNVSGVEIAHYIFPSLTKLALDMAGDDAVKDEVPEWAMQLLSGENIHLYGVREGDNLILASLPQTLIARERHKSNTTIAQWSQSQAMSRNESTVSIAANAENLPRKAYHMYLAAIQSLSDIAGVEPNLVALPLAEDLGLADSGRLGMALNTGKTSTSLTFEYDQTPMDYLSGGNAVATVAVMGVLAAVAIPAYQDYTYRARVSGALFAASQLKFELLEYYIENGALPSTESGEYFEVENDEAAIYFDPEAGVIKIVYAEGVDGGLSGAELNLVPVVSDGDSIEWVCSNVSVTENWLPSDCRN